MIIIKSKKNILLVLLSLIILTIIVFVFVVAKNYNKNNSKKIINTEVPNKPIVVDYTKKEITICGDIGCMQNNFKKCVVSQYYENNKPDLKTIAIFGADNNKCMIITSNDNFKNNIKCLFDKSLWENENIIKQLYESKDYGVKDLIDKNCSKASLTKDNLDIKINNLDEINVLDSEKIKSIPKSIISDEEALKKIPYATKLEK